ncbi:molybdopterin-dependent oxidoreductase [Lignipirellula cremea]|uniref:TMAO/DMSO reductase n=1 Tax=Lignipirellula cremea TaxID=2528010 RepID=A0A518DP50_9BACT|nr:molybdopterin-dependent oxidoreductase [Lignipirellula cremea]QDU93606.1 TMAO/DMSO reductase [Lignipirellula cremea]
MAAEPLMLQEHRRLSRRFFGQLAAGGALGMLLPWQARAAELPPECAAACESFLKQLEYLTPQEEFGNVSRGTPRPYDLPEEKKQEVGLTPESWRLEVVSDPDDPADIEQPLTVEAGTAIDWDELMKMAKQHAVSFPKIMTCNNGGRPLGMGIWEGVPLREIVWRTRPQQNLRRVFYNGFHNDDPKQLFRSSLPIGRVLEDPFDLPPVILCYKLNGQLLNGERGGPVRMVVPEAYGFKSVKWLQRIVLSNLFHANDTYASGNNDVDSGMKTFAHSLLKPEKIKAGQPIPITGYAQVGISGLKKVQTLLLPKSTEWPQDDPYYTQADWTDAHLLDPPKTWGGGLPDDRLPDKVHGFDPATGRPQNWPMRMTMAHWATVLPGLPAGEYTLHSRSIDANGYAQPMPRPFRKSGRNVIEETPVQIVE